MRLVAILALLAAPAALATHPSQYREVRANLDRDRALERVAGAEDVSSDHRVWRASVRVIDRCHGRNRTHVVVSGYERLESASPVQADGRGPSEVIGVLFGLEAGTGEARLVRLVIERSAAEVAIPGTCWIVLAAARASRHGRSVRRWAPQSTGNSQAYSEAMPARSDPSRAPMTASAASRLSG